MDKKAMSKKKQNGETVLGMLRRNLELISMAAFCVIVFVLVLVGVFGLRVPVVAMCVLAMIEAGIAVMLHRAEIWMHALLVIAEIAAGVLVDKLGLVILCAAVYIAATAALQALGRDE